MNTADQLERARAWARDLCALIDGYRASGDVSSATYVESATAKLRDTAGADGANLEAVRPDELSEFAWRLCSGMASAIATEPLSRVRLEAASALASVSVLRAEKDTARARMEQLRKLFGGVSPTLMFAVDGPILASGVEHVRNWLGEEIDAPPVFALCRCGASKTKPYCDGTHATAGFTSNKDPKRVPDARDAYVGEQVTIFDNRGTCQHSGFCTDRLPTVFRVREEPFVAPSGGRMDEIVRAVRDCPSGALSFAIDGVEQRSIVDWNGTRPASIEITKDGPYRVTGDIALVDENGEATARNAGASMEHCALCRCGHSQNKPFCSGMHWYVGFKDPAPQSDPPTIYEWMGGMPALLRLTRLFYEKYVPNDPILAPVFASMSADHPERVATWLAEVFGGPKRYSSECGGYEHMLSQHMGRCLTEEMRQRWVELLMKSAIDAGLPNDAEFASAFQSYIQWGSRLAVENSQMDSAPPRGMPMPHWSWETSAGPPGSRVSALGTDDALEDYPPPLPAPGETITFDAHIKALFRKRDRASMLFAFDLWGFDDVAKHADAILERLAAGTMPCDGAWPSERVEVFQRWIQGGKPKC